MSTIKVNTVTKRSGSTLTLGESGTTVTLACGASQSGFGRAGSVNWCSTIYKLVQVLLLLLVVKDFS